MPNGPREVIYKSCSNLQKNWLNRYIDSDIGNKIETAPPTLVSSRRCEVRIKKHRVCSYELCESIDEDAVVIQQGELYTLNRSANGILLLMGEAPRIGQLIELHIPESRWRHSLNLCEVRWTKPVHAGPQGDLYLVRCCQTLGPSPYWTF